MYGDSFFPVLLSPPAVLADIIRINHLRLQAFSHSSTESEGKALALLGRITAVSPEQRAISCVSPEKGIIFDHVYRSAVILYCTLSLQSLCILPQTAQLRSMTVTHAKELSSYLNQACGAPGKCMLWPLVVTAVCAQGNLCWRQLFPGDSGRAVMLYGYNRIDRPSEEQIIIMDGIHLGLVLRRDGIGRVGF